MDLSFDTSLANGYSSNSQIAKVLTENWVLRNSYCPCCGTLPLIKFPDNRPVADFHCGTCREEYELKSKKGKLSTTITDGAYSAMMERIRSVNNPNFFFLTYSKQLTVSDFMIVPKQFFTPDIIIKRQPLAPTARRAGWIGCNINVSKIANAGKVFLVKDAKIIDQEIVSNAFKRTLFLRAESEKSRGWLLDIMNCVDSIERESFTINDVYKFEKNLKRKYPNNNFIKDKIRQQLQVLRDKGLIAFTSRGNYKKANHGNI